MGTHYFRWVGIHYFHLMQLVVQKVVGVKDHYQGIRRLGQLAWVREAGAMNCAVGVVVVVEAVEPMSAAAAKMN